MVRTQNTTRRGSPADALKRIVEPRRKEARISLRTAAERAGMSEGTWRQLVAGGVMNGGRWITRTPRRDQVLDMALAVDVLEEVASYMKATADEVQDTRNRVVIMDPAEEEIMQAKHLKPMEKLHLLEHLHKLRGE